MTYNQPVSLCRTRQSKWNVLRKKAVTVQCLIPPSLQGYIFFRQWCSQHSMQYIQESRMDSPSRGGRMSPGPTAGHPFLQKVLCEVLQKAERPCSQPSSDLLPVGLYNSTCSKGDPILTKKLLEHLESEELAFLHSRSHRQYKWAEKKCTRNHVGIYKLCHLYTVIAFNRLLN